MNYVAKVGDVCPITVTVSFPISSAAWAQSATPGSIAGVVKDTTRAILPATFEAPVLRRTAERARRVVRPRHCKNWFAHAGYERK
jgi:hypothetical protein